MVDVTDDVSLIFAELTEGDHCFLLAHIHKAGIGADTVAENSETTENDIVGLVFFTQGNGGFQLREAGYLLQGSAVPPPVPWERLCLPGKDVWTAC